MHSTTDGTDDTDIREIRAIRGCPSKALIHLALRILIRFLVNYSG